MFGVRYLVCINKCIKVFISVDAPDLGHAIFCKENSIDCARMCKSLYCTLSYDRICAIGRINVHVMFGGMLSGEGGCEGGAGWLTAACNVRVFYRFCAFCLFSKWIPMISN